MIIAFCLYGFTAQNHRLQPWLTIHQVTQNFFARGHEIHIITNQAEKSEPNNASIHYAKTLRGTNSKQITGILNSIKPDCIIVDLNPFSLLTTCWYRSLKPYRALAYISYPFYKSRQIINAFPHIAIREIWEYGRHIIVPRFFWAKILINIFDGVICQSTITGNSITDRTRSRIPVHIIPPGIDKKLWNSEGSLKKNQSNKFFLYVGAANSIRGFYVVLDAFAMLSDPGIRLKILARGADEKTVQNIYFEIERRNLQKRVSIKGGFLEIDELKDSIQSSEAVLLPFVLVPSELPVSVMESIACGTPVIVSNVDGLASAAGDAGIVVPQGNPSNLASAIHKLYLQPDLLMSLKAACVRQTKKMLSWDSMADSWLKVIAA